MWEQRFAQMCKRKKSIILQNDLWFLLVFSSKFCGHSIELIIFIMKVKPCFTHSLSLCSYFVCCIYSQLTAVRVGRCLTGRRTVRTSLTGTQSTPVWTTPSLNSAASTTTERDTICLPLSSTQVQDLRNKLSLFLFGLDWLRMQLDWLLT